MEKKIEENILFPRKKEMKNNNPKMIHLNIDKVLGEKKENTKIETYVQRNID